MGIKIFIITLKNQARISRLKKIMKSLKLNYTIVKGIDGNSFEEKNSLDKIYDKNKTFSYIGRYLSASEIGCAASHLSLYKHIVKKNIAEAIIMEDDAVPSKKFAQWVNKGVKTKNNQIINFFSYPSGFVNKKPVEKIYNIANVHAAKTHLSGTALYQINKFTCKKILKINGNKVICFADWPFNILRNKINLFVTLPFLAFIDDDGYSQNAYSRNIILKKNKLFFIKKIFPDLFLNPLRYFYYLFCMPYILGIYKNFYYYFEHFLQKIYFEFLNIFTNLHYNLEKISYNKKYYPVDLRKYLNKKNIVSNQKKYKI
jgi:glycosyl transferase family 25